MTVPPARTETAEAAVAAAPKRIGVDTSNTQHNGGARTQTPTAVARLTDKEAAGKFISGMRDEAEATNKPPTPQQRPTVHDIHHILTSDDIDVHDIHVHDIHHILTSLTIDVHYPIFEAHVEMRDFFQVKISLGLRLSYRFRRGGGGGGGEKRGV